METQKVMRAWDNFVWAVLEDSSESLEDRKDGIRKVADAWLMDLFHQSSKKDLTPDAPIDTAKLALHVMEELDPLLEVFHDTVGDWFNQKQFGANIRSCGN